MNALEKQFFPKRGLAEAFSQFVPPGTRKQFSSLYDTLTNPQTYLTAAEYIGPAADMQDMKYYSGATMDELRAGNYAPALANLGMTGAAMAMTALPGNVGAVDDVVKRADFEKMASRGKVHQARATEADNIKAVQDGDAKAFKFEGIDDYEYESGDFTDRVSKTGLYIDDDMYGTVYAGKTKEDVEALRNARTPIEYGRAAGYSEDDIAAFYLARRRGDAGIAFDEYISDLKTAGPAKATTDLPMDTASRMKRAEEMGFDTDAYHGTASDVREFRKDRLGAVTKARGAKNAVWLSDSPKTASGYAHHAQTEEITKLIDASQAAERAGDWDAAHDLMVKAEQLEASGGSGGANVIAAKIRGNLMRFDAEGATLSELDDGQLGDLVQKAMDGGYDGLRIDNFSDEADWGTYNPTTHYAIFDPKNVRSRHAKFDPAKKDSADLLASIGGAGLLGALGLSQSDEFNERY